MFATIVSLDWQWQQGHGCQWVLQNMREKNFWFSFSVFFCCCFVDISSPSFSFAPTTFFLQTQDKKMKTPCFYFFFFPLRFSSFHKPPKKNLGKGRVLHFCSMMMATTMAVLLGNGMSMGVAKTQDQKKTQNGNGNKGMGVVD
jgi:hypothetical protein